MGTVVLGTGSCLPERVLTNTELESIVDTSDEWIRARTGIVSRRIGGKGELNYQLAAKAARRALANANVEPEEIGLVVVGTISSHMQMPSSACFVQDEIGAKNAFAFDLNAACSGFLYGLDLADKYIRADHSMKVLVIGAETLSSRLDWQDRNTCILFGDGAGAAVFGYAENERGVIGSNMLSDGSLWRLLHMHGPQSSNPDLVVEDWSGAYIRMEGREVFKHAVKAMDTAVRVLLERENISIDEVDVVIPHQANMRILNKLIDRLKVPQSKVFINVNKYGNTSAASIPIALDEANSSDFIAKGNTILFCSFGGGFTWGAALMKW
ncbi:beta-ketoacyl-ACP synthase III [Desulforhopalus singaporensis]|uniref:Beta-ketoacyl-[acyl-carrier-protein] synthase III n=1 Tax=Desulforhopalus singaporensis TaxID=91360 RepID=A0A1H0MM69_9BACT|nr:beta-ketoacyl-ACP synthase III [Desulforhopalus singaporensis]SDO81487.1 3-oxoacyl-[acyl-carrier-protein] synthase III [Desulforhopalus singaporensis]